MEGNVTMSPDTLHKLADTLTPKINCYNDVEYQTMRKHTKTYELVPFRDNSARETSKRIYDYLDNRKIIADYLTFMCSAWSNRKVIPINQDVICVLSGQLSGAAG